jgi:hypothetical protein
MQPLTRVVLRAMRQGRAKLAREAIERWASGSTTWRGHAWFWLSQAGVWRRLALTLGDRSILDAHADCMARCDGIEQQARGFGSWPALP